MAPPATRSPLLEDKYEAKTFTGTFNGNADVCNLNDGEIQVYGSVNDSEKVTANFKYDFDLKYIGKRLTFCLRMEPVEQRISPTTRIPFMVWL